MAFRFRIHEGVHEAIRRIARQELRGAIRDLREQQPDLHEAVHEVRKRCKKLRGLVRLVPHHLGDDYRVLNRELRDQARQLGFLRDSQAQLEALARLEAAQPDDQPLESLEAVKAHLLRSREQAIEDQSALADRLQQVTRTLRSLYRRVQDWSIPDEGFDALADGLASTYRRARQAMKAAYADPTDHHFHEWRKQVKYHWHHASLLVAMQPRLLASHVRLADDLAEYLGQDHDYAVLRQQLATADGSAEFIRQRELAMEAMTAQQIRLRQRMRKQGIALHAEPPRQLIRRWEVYWRGWQEV